MKSPALDAFEKTLLEMFTFDDNEPSTFDGSRTMFPVVSAYLENPFVMLKRISIARLRLLLRVGEYLYGMLGYHDKAILPLEQAVKLA
jgi:hypothetical protein